MNNTDKQKILSYLLQFVTENKQKKMADVLANRTRHITIALENVYQPHNASAALRSCDLFGIQDIHVIQNRNRFKATDAIAMGSEKWVNTYTHSRTATCIAQLKSKGYTIVATTPHTDACFLPDLPINNKTALLFGTEIEGLSNEALSLADRFVKIPMYGFTESFNVSVSVALCLYDISTRLRASNIDWQLSDKEQLDIMLEWARKTVRNSHLLEAEFLKKQL